jgi:hypothetical protein
MLQMLMTARAILHQFQASLGVLPVFLSRVGALFAFGASETHYKPVCFLLRSHETLRYHVSRFTLHGSKDVKRET